MKKPRSAVIICLALTLFLHSCSANERDIEEVVDDFYISFNDRQDFVRLLSFYDENIVLEGIIVNEDRIVGKVLLIDFFDRNNPDFRGLDSTTRVIEKKIFQGNTSVIKRYFTRFQ